MKLQFKLTFKHGTQTVSEVLGPKVIDGSHLNIGEISEEIIDTEAFIEKLTGLRLHIEQVYEES